MERKIVVGLTGPIASGKEIVSKVLKEKGFEYYSLSHRVREEAKSRGLEPTRETLQNVGDSLRVKFDGAVLAQRTADIFRTIPNPLILVDSIRNPAEIEYLRQEFNAKIIGVTASEETRFQRVLARNRDSDPKTFEEFVKAARRDQGLGQEELGQQVKTCLKLSDVVIENNGTVEELVKKVNETLDKLKIGKYNH
jgi:dephospho-CoA kinase